MRVETKKTVREYVEVELPYYSKSSSEMSFFKVLNEQGDYIHVQLYPFNTGVLFFSYSNTNIAFEGTTPCSEWEFRGAYDLALNNIKSCLK